METHIYLKNIKYIWKSIILSSYRYYELINLKRIKSLILISYPPCSVYNIIMHEIIGVFI